MKLNNNDFISLQKAVDVLESFEEITLRIQSDSVVNTSLLVPSVMHIIDHSKNIKLHVSLMSNLCKQLEDSINKRFSGIATHLTQQFVSCQ